jgi:hypothetical protein
VTERSVEKQVVADLERAADDERPASATCCMMAPATEGPTAQATFLVTLVTPLANVRSSGLTTAMT